MVKIYSLTDPRTNQIRYIGKTCQKYLSSRLATHIKDSRKLCTHNGRWVNSLVKLGHTPIIEIVDEVGEDCWDFWEIYYINCFKKLGCNLTNHSLGGGGNRSKGQKFTEEHKLKIGLANRKPRLNKENFGKARKRSVLQYTLNREFIKEHSSALDAYLELGIWKESIRNCCNNRSKSAGGYYWTYKLK